MTKLEIAAVLVVLAVVLGTPTIILGYQFAYRPAQDPQAITLIMRTAENGNFMPSVIRVKKGQLVRLHLTSYDVAHGFLIGELGVDGGVIEAGKWKTVEFVPEEAGEFSFTCNIRCSPQHAKVRGKIIVEE
jgi:cytochrome c oxidase subunit 2